jgi:uridine kinase
VLSDHPIVAVLPADDRAVMARYFDEVSVPEGECVVREGAHERELYLVHQGLARVTRRGVDVGTVEAGEHFGELGMITGRERAASVIAHAPLLVSRMSEAQLLALSKDRPDLALMLVRSLMSGIGDKLEAMTDSVGLLLRSQALRNRATIELIVDGEKRVVPTGTLLRDLLPLHIDGYLVVAALFDGRATSLLTPATTSGEVRALTSAHWEGKRVYRRSLALLLLEAARTVEPPVTVRMDYSLGFAQRVRTVGPGSANRSELATKLQERMNHLAREDMPIRRESWAVDAAIAHFESIGERGTAELLRCWRQPTVLLINLGDSLAIDTGPFLPSTTMMAGFEVVTDGDGLLLVYGSQGTESMATDRIIADARAASRHTREMTRDHTRWLGVLGVSTVGEFNAMCLRGSVSPIIQVAEGFHEKRVGTIADEIRERSRKLKLISISGPSSSGKTTFIKRLRIHMQVKGIRPVALSLDNYYVDRADTPRDESGDYDYESLQALRLDLLHEHIRRLLRGEAVHTPRYDFVTGIGTENGGPTLQLEDDHILLVEGIHGLNPALLPPVPRDKLFRIFVCPLAQLPVDRVTRIHASDLRLLRRIVRDRHSRGTSAADNIRRWPSVRRGERRHIYPFQDNADAVFDSSLIYEIAVMKVYAERYLLEVPRNEAEYATAFRLLQLTDSFISIYPDHVPPTSILREFIGESGFEY